MLNRVFKYVSSIPSVSILTHPPQAGVCVFSSSEEISSQHLLVTLVTLRKENIIIVEKDA